jgi:hypothetical protein
MATVKTVDTQEVTTFDDLFDLEKAEAPGLDVALTDEQRGARAARDRLADRMDADASEIAVQMENMAILLMEGGVVVDLDIHRWTGMVRLTPKDLGLQATKVASKAIQLGDKLLMPPTILRSLNSLTTRLRKNLERHSFSTMWGRWVTAMAYKRFKRDHDELAEEYMKLGELLADNIDAIRTRSDGVWGELRRLYAEHARAAWCRLNRLPVDEGHMDQCPATFVESYIQAILDHIPPADEIRRSFRVEAKISYIPLPSMLEEDQARSQRVWEMAEADRQADTKRRQAQAEMEADVRAHYIAQKEEMIDGFLAGLSGQMHSMFYDIATNALATMSRNKGQLLEPTLRQLRRLIEWGETMNVMDNQELDKAVNDLRAMIERAPEDRSAVDTKDQLQAIGTVARSVLIDLNLQPQVENGKVSIRQRDALLGIGKRLSRAKVAAAREHLDTDALAEPLIVRARRGSVKATGFQNVPQL